MAVKGISSRGVEVDFDTLRIKQQLASRPVTVGVNERRAFIDAKDGVKPKNVPTPSPESLPVRNALTVINPTDLGDALALSSGLVAESSVQSEEPVIK